MSDTILIESNREIAYAKQTENQDAPSNTWTTTLQNGIELDVGDEVSIDNIQINIRGVPDESIEFLGDNTNANTKGLKDNQGTLRIGYYMTNRLQFNMPLPLGHMVAKSYNLSVTNETNAGNPGMSVDKLSRVIDYGMPCMSSFQLFKQAYPYSQIEGFATGDPATAAPLPNLLSFSNPPNPIDNQGEIRLYLMNEDFKGMHGKVPSGTPVDTPFIPPNIRTQDISISIPEGFNTPDNVATNITEQMHNRLGKAEGWTSSFVNGQFFKVSGTPNTADSVISFTQNPVITDSCFRSVPTSTGDLYYSPPGFARFGDNTAEGTGYTARDGLNLFYKNLLIGNPSEYIAMCNYLLCRKNLLIDTDIEDAITNDLECVFTGRSENAIIISDGIGISNLGAFPCIMDRLDIESTPTTKVNPIGIQAASNPAHVVNVNVKLLDMPENALIPTNIPYTNANLKNIAAMMKALEKTNNSEVTLNTKNNFKNTYFVDMPMGRADDSFSCSSTKTFCGPPILAGGITATDAAFANNPLNSANKANFDQDITDMGYTAPNLAFFNASTAGVKLPAISVPQRRVGKIRGSYESRDNLSVFRFYDKNFDASIVDNPTHNFNTRSLFQIENPTTKLKQSMQLSIDNDVAVVPVFLQSTTNNVNLFGSNTEGIPFCAFVSVGVNNNKKVPAILGEYFGPSPSLHDNLVSKIVTTQKVQTTKGTYNTATNPTDYMPYCMIGADDPAIEFDNSRFKISGFHTGLRASNGTFQNPLGKLDSASGSTDKPSNPQADEISLQQNGQEAMISVYSPVGNNPTAPINVVQNVRPFPIISSQSGIGLIDILAVRKERSNAPSLDTILSVDSRLDYKGTIFDKLGFDIEQLHSPINFGENHQFNRSNYNKYIGRDEPLLSKQENMLYPFTTNAYISGSEQIGMVKNVKGSEMVNLGATNTFQSVFTNAESDELVARQLPKKLDFSYLVVYSNIIPNTNYYSAQSVKVPAMAYVTRSFTTGDFFFSSENPTYIVDKPYVITNFETRIVLPNGADANIDDNSTIIYKIIKKKTLPIPPQVPSRPKQK